MRCVLLEKVTIDENCIIFGGFIINPSSTKTTYISSITSELDCILLLEK